MNIGMVAMSGIRACDTELLQLGLTLPGFVERSKQIASLPSLGLLTLAGMTPRRHAVSYHEAPDASVIPSLPTDFDLVAVSSLSAQIKDAYRVAAHYRALGIPVLMGGLHVTSVPGEPEHHSAIAVLGEGELAWPRILEDAERGTLQPVYDLRGQEFDLADAPMPAYELLDIERYNRITVQTSRGCPWRCNFCASSILLTRKYKQKPIEKVLAEIDRIKSLWPRPFIEFADDNSFISRDYWHELLPQLAKRRIRWFTETDLSIYEDDALLAKMRKAGCAQVLIGFESPTADALGGVELRKNFKQKRYGEYKEAIRRIQGHGITVNACFVLGLDGHDRHVFDLLVDFVTDALPWDVQITLPTPFPGTPLYRQMQHEGRLIDENAWEKCTLFDINIKPKKMSVAELRAGFYQLTRVLYSDQFTQHRRKDFQRNYRRERGLARAA
ncbi:MAG: radical SAM protein [Burkholderiales bacterium]